MKTLRVSLDETLFEEIDRTVTALGTTPSDFTRDALRAALYRVNEPEMEARHRAGYERHPVQPGELDGWTDEQVWPE
jgi:metal-responsive CopG/Arc/MetJ family transcriptional regulator